MKKRRRSNHALLAYRADGALRKAVAEAILLKIKPVNQVRPIKKLTPASRRQSAS
jgi:hypothetical protein